MDAVEFGGGCDRHLMARKVLGKAVQVMVIFATMMLVLLSEVRDGFEKFGAWHAVTF